MQQQTGVPMTADTQQRLQALTPPYFQQYAQMNAKQVNPYVATPEKPSKFRSCTAEHRPDQLVVQQQQAHALPAAAPGRPSPL